MDIPSLALAFGKSFLLALAAVLPILNPPASAPIFVNLTRGLDVGTRIALATGTRAMRRQCSASPRTSRAPS